MFRGWVERLNQITLPPMLERWLLALTRIAIIFLVAAIIRRLPLPILEEWLTLKDIGVAVISVILAGKCLYDTLFYDHFQS